ncbi:3prime-5prime exonuclease eri1 [Diplonema papillatum]|nr:3prime-5prime exonuclease eri1 [Diplonema papillatum]
MPYAADAPPWMPSGFAAEKKDAGKDKDKSAVPAEDELSSASMESNTTETTTSGERKASRSCEAWEVDESDVSVNTRGVVEGAAFLPPPTVYLCLDIEATCDGTTSTDRPGSRHFRKNFENEILELPIEAVDAKTGQVLSEMQPSWRFHSYVYPEIPPTLFCTELTGIDSATLSSAPPLGEVLSNLEDWLCSHKLAPWPLANVKEGGLNFIWVTDGTWDFGKFLWNDCKRKGIDFPFVCAGWCDARRAFQKTWPKMSLRAPVLQNMVNSVGISWSGKPHRGHVDTKNLASLVSVIVNCNSSALLPTRCIPQPLLKQQQHVAMHRGKTDWYATANLNKKKHRMYAYGSPAQLYGAAQSMHAAKRFQKAHFYQQDAQAYQQEEPYWEYDMPMSEEDAWANGMSQSFAGESNGYMRDAGYYHHGYGRYAGAGGKSGYRGSDNAFPPTVPYMRAVAAYPGGSQYWYYGGNTPWDGGHHAGYYGSEYYSAEQASMPVNGFGNLPPLTPMQQPNPGRRGPYYYNTAYFHPSYSGEGHHHQQQQQQQQQYKHHGGDDRRRSHTFSNSGGVSLLTRDGSKSCPNKRQQRPPAPCQDHESTPPGHGQQRPRAPTASHLFYP